MHLIRTAVAGFVCACLTASCSHAAEAAAESLITTKIGTLPIVITAPHGGLKDVPGVPARVDDTANRFVTGTDKNTAELARRIAENLARRLKGEPHLVVAQFRRRFIDANREAKDAYESPAAKPVYDAYHHAVDEACRAVKNKFGGALLIDVHGQAAYVDKVLIGTIGGKTVTLLRERHGTPALIGQNGMVGFLNTAGFRTAPEVDAVKLSLPAYDGGFTVLNYGSQNATGIDAIQFEFGSELRDPQRLSDTAERAAAAIAQFYAAYLPKKPLKP